MNFTYIPLDFDLVFGLLFGFYTVINLMHTVSYAFRRFDKN